MWRKWWWRERPDAFHYVRCSTWYSTVTTTKATNTITKKRQETVAMDHLHQSDTIRMQWWWQRQLLRDFDWCILQWRQCIFQNGQEKGSLDGCCKSMVLMMTDPPIAHPEMNTSAVVMAALRWGGQGWGGKSSFLSVFLSCVSTCLQHYCNSPRKRWSW